MSNSSKNKSKEVFSRKELMNNARFQSLNNSLDTNINDYLSNLKKLKTEINYTSSIDQNLWTRIKDEYSIISKRKLNSDLSSVVEDARQRTYLRQKRILIFEKDAPNFEEYTTFQGNMSSNLAKLLILITKETILDNKSELIKTNSVDKYTERLVNSCLNYLHLKNDNNTNINTQEKEDLSHKIINAEKTFLWDYESLLNKTSGIMDKERSSFNKFILGITQTATYHELKSKYINDDEIMKMKKLGIVYSKFKIEDNPKIDGYNKKTTKGIHTNKFWTNKYYYAVKIKNERRLYSIINMTEEKPEIKPIEKITQIEFEFYK